MGNLSVVLLYTYKDTECQTNASCLFFFWIVQEESKSRTLILIAGFIHDVSSFLDDHPGGKHHLIRGSGKEMTASFFGGVYTHSSAAHNVSLWVTIKIHNKSDSQGFLFIYIASVYDANRRVRWRRGSGVST